MTMLSRHAEVSQSDSRSCLVRDGLADGRVIESDRQGIVTVYLD